MRVDYNWLLRLALLLALFSPLESRRVRVQPVDEDDQDIQYYSAADAQDDGSHRQLVLVSQNDYNGIYNQPAISRNAQDNYIPASRTASSRASYKESRAHTKESNKSPPVQTIRNYNKVNDDGSFTFGYEAADGSFKEETRGTDCVVRGKYGYIDPDGNKREFTYVSGNPCDPNAPKDEESQERPDEDTSNEPENVPANYPTRPIRPIRPVTTPKPVTVFQNAYAQDDDEVEQPEPEQVLRAHPVQPTRHRLLPIRPTYIPEERPLIQSRPRLVPSTTPSSLYQDDSRPLTITPRPVTVSPTTTRAQPPATTYRPQLLQVAVTPRPALVYTTKQLNIPTRTSHFPSSTPATYTARPGQSAIDFVSEYQKFQSDNQISSTPSPATRTTKPNLQADISPNSNPVYSSELVFDPASGQYKTALYQTLPQTDGDFRLSHQIQPYVHNPGQQLVNFRQLQQQSPLYRPTTPRATQAAYQQQQAELQFQNSQQLFAQQQRARAQQQAQSQPVRTEPQQFYYIQPQSGLSTGQIDAFLRGHNIQF